MNRAASPKVETPRDGEDTVLPTGQGSRRCERQRPGMLVFTTRGHQVRHLFAEDVLRVFGPASARGTVERGDRLAVVGGDQAARVVDGLGGRRIFGARAEVDLTGVGGADVVAFVPGLPQVPLNVGAGGHGLRLEGFDLSEGRGAELVRHDAAQVLFDRQLVDDRQRAPGCCRRFRARRGRRGSRSRAARWTARSAVASAGGSASTTSPSSSTVIRS